LHKTRESSKAGDFEQRGSGAIDMERRNWRKLEGRRLRAAVQLYQQIWKDEIRESSKAGDFAQRCSCCSRYG